MTEPPTPPVEASDERRSEDRALIELKVEYQRLNGFFADYTRNISRGGTFIRTLKPLPVGTEFNFVLVVPTLAEPLSIRGEVRWVKPPGEAPSGHVPSGEGDPYEPGMGIRFHYESEAERARVEAVVEELMVHSLGQQLSDRLLGR